MNKRFMLYTFIVMNLVGFAIDPIMGVVFLCMWPVWYWQNREAL